MQTRRISDISMISAIVALILGFSASPALAASSTCVDNGTVKVCAEWSSGMAPVEGTNFEVTFNGSAGADVELITGDLEWRLWTKLLGSGAVHDFGDITIDPTVTTDDFEVTIKDGTNAGAADVGTINLKDPSFTWTGYSSIEGASHITGSLTGPLTVIQDSGGVGGELTMTIGGDVTAAITVPVVNSLTITGDLTANLTVSDIVEPPGIDIGGDVAAGVTISLANMNQSTTVVEIGSATGQFEGELVLLNGIPRGTVKILSDIGSATSTPQIDLNNKTVAGRLECLGDNEGNIINGNEVKNLVTLASGSGNSFSGTATFHHVRITGRIDTTSSANMNGVLRTTSYSDGTISIDGGVGSSGKIWVEGALLANAEILIDGDLNGDVDIDGAQAGDVLVDGKLSGSGRILVDGLCSGTIGIGGKTTSLTLIHLLAGLDSGGTIEINQGDGSVNADGDIHIGPTGESVPPITFDGCIRIYEDSQGIGGGLEGDITIQGCHATTDSLNICIDGPVNGDITIVETDCVPTVHSWSCGGCP